MRNSMPHQLVRIGDSDLSIGDPAEDARGRTIVDRDGEEVGTVKSILVDEDERKVRMLEVESGGFLGVGGQARLIPVDAVTSVAEDTMHVDTTREDIHGAPTYDPQLIPPDVTYYGEVYGYYGYAPYWGPSSTYPR